MTEHGGLGHTSAVYARDEAVVQAFAARIRTGRILVNAPTAVGALGGIYTAMPPTFSLGCGTWGGSTTTDNVNYRNLLNIKAVSRRQAPPQWFRVPSEHVLQRRRARRAAHAAGAHRRDRHRRADRRRAARSTRSAGTSRATRCT